MNTSTLPPGPRLPRTAQAVLWTYRYPEFTQRAHERYGHTFTARVGDLPTSVVTVDRDAIRRLFTGDPLAKRHDNDLLRPFVGDRSVLMLEPAEHLQRRKLLLPPFHGERIRAYAELMEQLIAVELDRWRVGEVVRILPIAQNLTLEVILQAVLGISDGGMRRRLREHYDAMLRVPGSSFGWYFPKLTSRRNPLIRRYWRLKDELDALLLEQIAATRTDPRLAARDDVLALLVQARDEAGEGLTDGELRDELNTLLIGGHETTAIAIAWGAQLLAHNPAVRERARAAADTHDDEYLDALVKEILRMRSPFPAGAARYSREPFPIDEFTIDPAVPIIVNAHGLHNDPAIYSEPQRMRPERFLEHPPDSYAYLPFGGGAHRCIGASLAQLEIRIVLGAMLTRHDLAPADAGMARPVRRAIVLAPGDGGSVRVATAPTREHATLAVA